MKAIARLCLAVALLMAARSDALAVTVEECNAGCSAAQSAAASACQSSCTWGCGGKVRYAIYMDFGCYPDQTYSYCITDGYCDCECDYI